MTFPFSDDEERTADLLEWLVACVQGWRRTTGPRSASWRRLLGTATRTTGPRSPSTRPPGWMIWSISNWGSRTIWRFLASRFSTGVSESRRLNRFWTHRGTVPFSHAAGARYIESVHYAGGSKDAPVSRPSKASSSVALQSSPEQAKLAFVNELFGLVVSVGGIKLEMRTSGSSKLRIAHLAQSATMLSWGEDEFRIRVTGDDAPEIEIPTVKVMQIPALDRSVALLFAH